MKQFFIRFCEALFVVLLGVFIVFVSAQDKMSDAPLSDVEKNIVAVCNKEGLLKEDGLKLKKQFALDADSLNGFCYYASDSVMDVREVLIIHLKDVNDDDAVKEKIESYAEEKEKLFEGYAPEESDLIKSRVLVSKNGYVFFYVGNEAERALSAFYEIV